MIHNWLVWSLFGRSLSEQTNFAHKSLACLNILGFPPVVVNWTGWLLNFIFIFHPWLLIIKVATHWPNFTLECLVVQNLASIYGYGWIYLAVLGSKSFPFRSCCKFLVGSNQISLISGVFDHQKSELQPCTCRDAESVLLAIVNHFIRSHIRRKIRKTFVGAWWAFLEKRMRFHGGQKVWQTTNGAPLGHVHTSAFYVRYLKQKSKFPLPCRGFQHSSPRLP